MAYLRCESNVLRRPRSADPHLSPGIHLKVEVGVSFPCAQRSASTGSSVQRRPETYIGYYAPGPTQYLHPNYPMGANTSRHTQQKTYRRPQIRDNSHRRGTSEPRTTSNNQEQNRYLLQHAHTFDSTTQRANVKKPLPPLPSSFRLGEDQLPWVSPDFPYEFEQYEEPTIVTIQSTNKRYQLEDPQRVRELEDLQSAMMTVNALDEDEHSYRQGYDQDEYDQEGTWDSDPIISPLSSNTPSLGWALPMTSADRTSLSPWDNPRYVPFSSEEFRQRSFTG